LAGTVALLLSAGLTDAGTPGLFDDVKAQLCATADDGFGVNSTPIPTNDPRYPTYFGCGVINADGAVLGSNPPPTNRSPVAADDAATTVEDGPVSVGILANDTDPDGDPLHVASVGIPAHGTAILDPSGTAIQYTPAPNYAGPDSFGYVVADDGGASDTGTVSITVTPVNDAPVAVDDALSVAEDAAPTSLPVLANDTDVDGDNLSTTSVTDPAHGTASVNADGSVAYAPDPGYTGPDAFAYAISDGAGGSDSAGVAVTVSAVDDPPTADPKTASTTSPNAVTIGLSGTDPDTCELTFQVLDLPDHGGVGSLVNLACTAGSPNADAATLVYTPTAGYSGPDTFTYRVLDGSSASAPATVSITVAPAPPTTIHVGDLDATATVQGKNWTARVTIRVDDTAHTAVAGAVVRGSWSAGSSGTATCTTTSSGTCAVQKAKLSRASVASVTFTVTSVTVSGLTYLPGSNHDPDGGNGTAIVILRPT
ncbi:MAG TPA: Ig-like domain-containing protein, partial [Candidatus Limnocylindrales bacterium]|nr:Ig-like domain-containing protein [Candidatus Limnocylindrales bacterium]